MLASRALTVTATGLRKWARAISGAADAQRLFKEDMNMLYDSKCNLCMAEVAFLSKRDTAGRIRFTDIESIHYQVNAPENGGVSYEAGMKVMHGVLPSGELIRGVEVIRKLYDLVGLGIVFRFTALPGVKFLADTAYNVWARYRTQVTRGETLDDCIRKRNALIAEQAEAASCGEGACESMRQEGINKHAARVKESWTTKNR